jgi:hypothetical protein
VSTNEKPPTLPICYREFWDVPRIFLTQFRDRTYLFDCPLDENIEDFPETYQVYEMPDLSNEVLHGTWESLSTLAVRWVGEVPISSVSFDPTKRNSISSKALIHLIQDLNGQV